jgi:16S rRNA (cytidine1402-2'-O)-methyltransferase
LIPTVVASPTDTSAFTFLGFLPIKKWRQTILKSLLESTHPVYFYESVHRIEKTCQQLQEIWFAGTVFIARELTKLHEQKISGTCEEILTKIKNKEIPLKGEFVVWVRNQ